MIVKDQKNSLKLCIYDSNLNLKLEKPIQLPVDCQTIIGVSFEPMRGHLTILSSTSQWFIFQLQNDALNLYSTIRLKNIRFSKPTSIVASSPGYVAMIVRGSITIWCIENSVPFMRKPKVFSTMPTHVNVSVL